MIKISVTGIGEIFVVAAQVRSLPTVWLFSLGWNPAGALNQLERKVRAHRLSPVEVCPAHSREVGTALEEYLHILGECQAHQKLKSIEEAVKLCLTGEECPYRWKEVYTNLMELPRGTVTTYRELAKKAGISVRSVAWALAYNPYPIVVPCHRVIMSNGQLGGYTPLGTPFKRYLLCLEGVKNL